MVPCMGIFYIEAGPILIGLSVSSSLADLKADVKYQRRR